LTRAPPPGAAATLAPAPTASAFATRWRQWRNWLLRVAGGAALAVVVVGIVVSVVRARRRRALRSARLRERCRLVDPDIAHHTIFVSIVARGPRDQRAAAMLVGALFDRARYPVRIHVGLCCARETSDDSSSSDDDDDFYGDDGSGPHRDRRRHRHNSHDDSHGRDDVDIIDVYATAYPHHEGRFDANIAIFDEEPNAHRGPANAMLLVQRHLYRGQRYYATMSVKCRPCHGWDAAALADLDRATLHRTTSDRSEASTARKVIITMRPDDDDYGGGDDDDDDEDIDGSDDWDKGDVDAIKDQSSSGKEDRATARGKPGARWRFSRREGPPAADLEVEVKHGGANVRDQDGTGASRRMPTRRGIFARRLHAAGAHGARQKARTTAHGSIAHRPPTFSVFETWSPRGLPVLRTRPFRHSPSRPMGTPFWHSAFSLCEASALVKSAPWDPWYEHLGLVEAIDWCTTVRLWTLGWDCYSPTRGLVRRVTKNAHGFEPLSPVAYLSAQTRQERDAAYVRVWTLLGMAPPWPARLDEYGLGSARAIEDFIRLSGIDWLDRRADAHAFVGMWPMEGDTSGPVRFDGREVVAKYGSWARFLHETDYRAGAAVHW
jgi:hypothetical protein